MYASIVWCIIIIVIIITVIVIVARLSGDGDFSSATIMVIIGSFRRGIQQRSFFVAQFSRTLFVFSSQLSSAQQSDS